MSIYLGAGNDTLVLNGAGNDIVQISNASNVLAATAAGIEKGLITITDFSVSQDVYEYGGATRTLVDNVQLADIAGKAALLDAVKAAADLIVDSFAVFNYQGEAYVLYDSDASGHFSANDGLVRLAGVSVADLSAIKFHA